MRPPAGEGPAIAAGRVEEILVYPEKWAPARECREAIAVAGVGLAGDHRRNPSRAVTLLSIEAWEQAMALLGAALPPRARRANLVVRGLDLGPLVGRRLRIGGAELRVRGETVPCDRMDLQRAGLQEALRLDMRGGVFGPVERSGPIRLGDPVVVLEERAV